MQGNIPFLVAVLFPFQINVYAFPCGAIVSFPIKRAITYVITSCCLIGGVVSFPSKAITLMQGNIPFLVAVLFPFQINVYAFPCGAIVSFPIKYYCQ
jgi:hypothetical protein